MDRDALFQWLFQQQSAGIAFWHRDGRLYEVNDAFLLLIGYTRQTWGRGRTWIELAIQEEMPLHADAMRHLERGERVRPYEAGLLYSDRARVDALWAWALIDGYSDRGTLVLLDSSIHKNAIVELRRIRDRIDRISRHMEDIVTIHDREHRYVYASAAIQRVMPGPPEAVLGKTPGELGFSPVLTRFFERTLNEVIADGQTHSVQYEDNQRYYHSILTPELDEAGLVRFILVVTRDITQLQQQARQREEFISLVSHELKTPVTNIKAMVQLALRSLDEGAFPEARQMLSQADRQINKQTRLIDHLMQLSRLESGQLELHRVRFLLRPFLQECIDALAPFHSADLLYLDCPADLVISADRDRLEQVIGNLLSNASRYSSPASPIYITASVEQGFCHIRVKDAGIGIPAEQVAFLFDRFYRVPGASHRAPGLGVGLYIVLQIVQWHGGSMTVDSEPGRGSTFTVRLPVDPDNPENSGGIPG